MSFPQFTLNFENKLLLKKIKESLKEFYLENSFITKKDFDDFASFFTKISEFYSLKQTKVILSDFVIHIAFHNKNYEETFKMLHSKLETYIQEKRDFENSLQSQLYSIFFRNYYTYKEIRLCKKYGTNHRYTTCHDYPQRILKFFEIFCKPNTETFQRITLNMQEITQEHNAYPPKNICTNYCHGWGHTCHCFKNALKGWKKVTRFTPEVIANVGKNKMTLECMEYDLRSPSIQHYIQAYSVLYDLQKI